MALNVDATVSARGQTSLPATLRRRWGLLDGGRIGVIDLGDCAVIVPGGIEVAKAELLRVLRERYEIGIAMIDDPDLVDQ